MWHVIGWNLLSLPTNLIVLHQKIQKEWNNVSQDIIRHLYNILYTTVQDYIYAQIQLRHGYDENYI